MSYEVLEYDLENDEILDNEILDDEIFDTNWISEYENNETYYSMFYPEVNKSLKVNMLYVNKKKELEKIRETIINLQHDNLITKQEWIRLVKDNNKIDKQKYKLVGILVYNFELQHDELKNFFKYSKKNRENVVYTSEIDEFNNKYEYMKKLTTIDDFHLSSTINCLQSVNNIFILFGYDETQDNKQNENIKKIYPNKNLPYYETTGSNEPSTEPSNEPSTEPSTSIIKKPNSMGTTKRVRFSLLSPSKKTRRKK